RAGGVPGRDPAQVAVHAVGSQRALLPADGHGAPGVLAHAGVSEGHRRAGRRPQPDGHRDPARTPFPRAQALDDPAALRRGRPASAPRGTHAPGARVRLVGRAQRSLRARCAGPFQRRLLPPQRRSIGRGQRARARAGERVGRRRPVAPQARRALHAAARDRQPAYGRDARAARVGTAELCRSGTLIQARRLQDPRGDTFSRGEHVMSVRKRILIAAIAAVACAAAPRPASADSTVTPFVGWNTGRSAAGDGPHGSTPTSTFEHKISLGVSVAGMANGAVGMEVDLGYSPNFFATNTNANGFRFTNDSNVLTLTGNLIVGVPIGGHGGSIRPYAVGGVGLIRSNVRDFAGV